MLDETHNALYITINVGDWQTDDVRSDEQWVLKYRLSDGSLAWSTRLEFPPEARYAMVRSAAVDAQGRVYALGKMARRLRHDRETGTPYFRDPQIVLFRLDGAEGYQEWRYVHPRVLEYTWHIVMGPRGTFYVGDWEYTLKFGVLAVRSDGDVTGNGCVEDSDLGRVLLLFRSEQPDGDVNGDGWVDHEDVARVLENFGLGCWE